MKPFPLPPGVTFERQSLADGMAFVFRHNTLGLLGRLVLQDIDGNNLHASTDVVGDPDDPMTAERKRIIQPLAEKLLAMLPDYGSPKPTLPIPPPPPPPQGGDHIVESKLIPCDHCGAPVAMLIMANDSTDPGHFEDYARMMFAQIQKLAIPTWIMGPPKNYDPDGDAAFMKVWPTRGPLQRLSPEKFNPLIESLVTHHCHKPTSF